MGDTISESGLDFINSIQSFTIYYLIPTEK
jgi:hypothetical protein